MLSKCVECDHLLVGDEVEYLYKGKSNGDDCYNSKLRNYNEYAIWDLVLKSALGRSLFDQ
jgi:hypothetical protein